MDERTGSNRQRWVCKVCGYVYDPACNDGVAFEDLPNDYRCPGCGFGKAVFTRERETKLSANDEKGLKQ
jgi:rubredoxin